MSLFKKQVTKPMPAGAEIVCRKGQRCARWKDRWGKWHTAPLTVGRQGTDRIVLQSRTYYGRFRDHSGLVIERPTGCRDETAARQVVAEWERQAERIRAGVLTADETRLVGYQATPIGEHFDAYLDYQRANGTSKAHQADTRRYLDRLARDCGFTRLMDLAPEVLERWLVARQDEGMSARSRNAYRNAMVAFCNWCVPKRLATNPLVRVPKADEEVDPRRRRRAMTEAELLKLLAVARERPLLDALTVRRGPRKGERSANVRPKVRRRLELLGTERALIYKTMVLTGLRKKELASLTVGQLHLEDPLPFAELEAADEKNREGNCIPIRSDLANDLRQWLADKLAALQAEARDADRPIPPILPCQTKLFDLPNGLRRILDRDLKFAGIPKRDPRGRTLDVHALRHTFGTMLSKGGVAPRTAQAAMRHSDIKLTMNVYTDPKLLDVHGALDALPSLPMEAGRTANGDPAKATPTTRQASPEFARQFAGMPCKPKQTGSNPDMRSSDGMVDAQQKNIAVSSTADKREEPPTIPVSGSSCRGDWIRTSDLLNPILGVEAAPSRRISQMQAFWRLTDSTLRTIYADPSRESTNRPHFPGYTVPKRARLLAAMIAFAAEERGGRSE
jgi:integrase